jgi:hypothetical protein
MIIKVGGQKLTKKCSNKKKKKKKVQNGLCKKMI